MRRIIVNNQSGRKTSCATRTRARGATKEQKRLAKLGKVGMFEFTFSLIKNSPGCGINKVIIDRIKIKTDSYDDAILYAHYNTPDDHQGIIDGVAVICK